MFGRLTALILDHRGVTAALLVAIVLACSAGIARLGFDFSVARFFAADDPETTYLQEHLGRWDEEDLLVVVIDGHGESLLTGDRLRRIEAVREALEALDSVDRATAATSVPLDGTRVAGAFLPRPLLATVPRTEEVLAPWRARVLADGRVIPTLVSADGLWGSILVRMAIDVDDLAAVTRAVRGIDATLDTFEADDDLSYALAGVPAIRASVLGVMLADQVLFVPIAGALMALLLVGLFRSLHGVIIPSVAAVVPLAMLLGWMGYVGHPIGLLNQIFLVLIPVIAVADAIHLVSRYHEEAARTASGAGLLTEEHRRSALVVTMQHMGMACFLTSFTTLIGFLSLNTTDLQVLQEFGTYAGIGIVLSYLTVLIIVPLSLSMARRNSARPTIDQADRLGRLLDWCVHFSVHHPWPTLAVTALVTILAGVAGSRVRVDFQLTGTFDDDNPVTLANRDVDTHLGGLLALELDLSGPPGAFADPAVLAAVLAAEDAVATTPEVRAVWGIGRHLAWTSKTLGGPLSVPQEPATLARVEKLADQGGALAAFVTPERDHARMVVRLVDVGAAELIDVAARLDRDVEALVGPVGVSAHPTGSSLVAYRGLAQVSSDLRDSLLSAAVVIALIIALLFRSVGLGLLSLVPNLVPLVIGYGAMGVFGWSLDPAPAVVFSVALGIAVDSTIHVLVRFREERQSGCPVPEAVERSIHASGRAVAVTAFILTVGFGVNALSAFPANATFGVLGAVITFVALASNLLVLPALLVAVLGRVSSPGAARG